MRSDYVLPMFCLLLGCSSTILQKEPIRRPSSQSSDFGPAQFVLPKPKVIEDRHAIVTISASSKVRVTGKTQAEDRYAVRILQDELLARAGRGSTSNVIELKHVADWSWLGRDLGEEGYVLDIAPEGISATATNSRGLFYAAQTLLQLASRPTKESTPIELPALRILDWPDMKDRMVLYDLRFDNFNLDYMKRWVHELSRLKINQFMIFLSGDYVFQKYPFVASSEKLTPAKLQELTAYARAHHVQLVPQLESLGHASGVLAHEQFKDLRLNANNSYAYSPCTERTYSVLNDFYFELAKGFNQSTLFHVGGDEVWGFDQDSRCASFINRHGQEHLYSRHMQKLANLLKPLNRRMAIWGDMILKHPDAADGIDRNIVIFDWDYSEDYKRFDDFPSLKFFKDLGFQNIYATSAVLGFNDMYPLYPVAFQNIRGFTRAALRENIKSECVTIWETQPGNNAENYLYGLAWGAQMMWSSQTGSDIVDFNHRFAGQWFGIDDDTAGVRLDQAIWFPWRVSGSGQIAEKTITGYWQIEHLPGELLYQDFNEFVSSRKADELERMDDESDLLLANLDVAASSINWLEQRARTNLMTIKSMRMTNIFYRYLALKVRALSRLANGYQSAYSKKDRDLALHTLESGVQELTELRTYFPLMKQQMELAVAERNRHPDELRRIDQAAKSLDQFSNQLTKTKALIVSGGVLPDPGNLWVSTVTRLDFKNRGNAAAF